MFDLHIFVSVCRTAGLQRLWRMDNPGIGSLPAQRACNAACRRKQSAQDENVAECFHVRTGM